MTRQIISSVLISSWLLISLGCSRSSIGPDEAQANLKAEISIAAEMELFLTFVAEGHSTPDFTKGHIAYLEQELERLHRQLDQSQPEPSVSGVVSQCRAQWEVLHHELLRFPASLESKNQLLTSRARIAAVRKTLEGLQSSR